MSNKRSIIEIVLVVAIAALIFLVSFLVVPTVQRAARDQQRKSDLGQFLAVVEEWRLNHPGNYIDTEAEFDQLTTRFSETHKEPLKGGNYNYEFREQNDPHLGTLPPQGQIVFSVAHKCGSDVDTPTHVTVAPGKGHYVRIYSVLLSLETGNTIYCLDND